MLNAFPCLGLMPHSDFPFCKYHHRFVIRPSFNLFVCSPSIVVVRVLGIIIVIAAGAASAVTAAAADILLSLGFLSPIVLSVTRSIPVMMSLPVTSLECVGPKTSYDCSGDRRQDAFSDLAANQSSSKSSDTSVTDTSLGEIKLVANRGSRTRLVSLSVW